MLYENDAGRLTFSMFRKVCALRPPVSRKMGRVKLSVFTSFSSKTLCVTATDFKVEFCNVMLFSPNLLTLN